MISGDLSLHKVIGNTGAPIFPDWERPTEWPVIDTLIGPSDDKLVAVFKVSKSTTSSDGAPVALTTTCTGGTYTVNWGDGTSSVGVASGVKAEHLYDYMNATLTDTTYGYKCAVITVTATANISLINLKVVYTGGNINAYFGYGWLDIDCRLPTGSASIGSLVELRQVRVRASSLANMNSYFSGLTSLENVVEFNNSATITNSNSLFTNCNNIRDVSFINDLTFSSTISDLSNFYNNCVNLYEAFVPMNTGSCSNFSNMFFNCNKLTYIPWMDTSSGTNLSSMFRGCQAIETIPALDTSSCTNFGSMFWSCFSLLEVPPLDTSAGTVFSNMFRECGSIEFIPSLDMTSLATITTNINDMFGTAGSLKIIPAFTNLGAPTTSEVLSGFMNGNFALERVLFTRFGGGGNITLANCYNLGTDALNEIFTNLVNLTGFTSRSITVSACRGRLTCNTTIATAKNWTVVT